MSEQNEEAKEVKIKGLTLLIDEEGKLKLTPLNVNELELIGLLDYANQKKQEMLQVISNSLETRTLSAVSQLTGVLSQVLVSAKEQLDLPKVAS